MGNLTAHEAGHFFGNFHTDTFTGPHNIMARIADLEGLGSDGVFGTADDIDIDLGPNA